MSPKSVADNGGVATGFSAFNHKAVMDATGKYVEYAKLAKILGAVTNGNKKLSIKTVVDTPTNLAGVCTILSFRSVAGAVVEIGFWTTGKMYAYSTASASVYSTSVIGAGKHTLEWVFDGTNVYFYTDGVANGSVAFTFTAWTNQTTRIGAYTLGTSQALLSTLYSIDIYNATHTAEEAKDLYERDTFSELENPSIYLPLRSRYNDGVNMVTKNLGTLGGTALIGDGSTTTTMPTQLSPHGVSFDGGDYLVTNYVYTDYTKPFTVGGLVKSFINGATQRLMSNFSAAGSGLDVRISITGSLQVYIYKTSSDYIARGSTSLIHTEKASWFVTYDGSGTKEGLHLFIDGVEVAASLVLSGTFGAFTNTSPIYIGSAPVGVYYLANGTKVWKPFMLNLALTPMQVRALHQRMISSLNV